MAKDLPHLFAVWPITCRTTRITMSQGKWIFLLELNSGSVIVSTWGKSLTIMILVSFIRIFFHFCNEGFDWNFVTWFFIYYRYYNLPRPYWWKPVWLCWSFNEWWTDSSVWLWRIPGWPWFWAWQKLQNFVETFVRFVRKKLFPRRRFSNGTIWFIWIYSSRQIQAFTKIHFLTLIFVGDQRESEVCLMELATSYSCKLVQL